MGNLTTRQLSKKRSRRDRTKDQAGLQPGDMLQDRYRIVGSLGAGGFSSVYQARDMRFPSATKLCAVKEMLISASDPQIRKLTIKSFEREASMLAMLNHPAIPEVSDYFTEGDRSYLVLELIRGKDLQHWLEETDEFLDEEQAMDWMLQLCDALGYLHSQKPQPIVFRDMKPSNIMIDQFQRVRLIDFGIAKLFEAGNKGTMIGTEGYSPPEQYRGEATPAGDVYALGATMHHVLTRRDPRLEPPFTFAERPIREVNEKISAPFEGIIMRCLAYDPQERFSDAKELEEALRMLSQSQTTTSVSGKEQAASPGETTVMAEKPETRRAGGGIEPIWTFKCEDEIRSKAAVDGQNVYIGAYDNNLYALARDTGEFLWKYPTADGVGSSPFVYKGNVFIGSADSHLYAITTHNGRVNWKFGTDGPIYSSPVVHLDHAFIGSDDGHVYAVNVKQGRQAWKANAFAEVRSTPFVDDERIFVGTEGGYIYCMEITTGETKWQFQAKRAVTSSPTVQHDMLVVGSMDTTVYALDATSGWAIWRFRTRRPIISSPVIDDDLVFIGSSDGNLYAIDVDSGRQVWQFETEGQVASSPAVLANTVYFGSTDGKIYALTRKRGKLQWEYETGGPVISSPTIMDGIMYIGSTDQHIYAFSL